MSPWPLRTTDLDLLGHVNNAIALAAVEDSLIRDEGLPRQLGDVVVCPQVVGRDWRRPLVHGLLHLLGHEHGPTMEALEEAWS